MSPDWPANPLTGSALQDLMLTYLDSWLVGLAATSDAEGSRDSLAVAGSTTPMIPAVAGPSVAVPDGGVS